MCARNWISTGFTFRSFGHKLANDCLSQTDGGSVNCSLPLWSLKQCQWMSLNQKQGWAVRKMPPWAKRQFVVLLCRVFRYMFGRPGFVYLSLGVEKITWAVDHFSSVVPPKCYLWEINISILYKSRSSRVCFWKRLTVDFLPHSIECARYCCIPVCVEALESGSLSSSVSPTWDFEVVVWCL